MAANYNDIKQWFNEGASNPDNTHMIIVCDTFDYNDYPVYVTKSEDVRKIESEYKGKSMQKVMEVYNLKADRDKQLGQKRNFNY